MDGLLIFWFVQLGTVFLLAGVGSEALGQLYTEDGSNFRIARAVLTHLPRRVGRMVALCIGLVLSAIVVGVVIGAAISLMRSL